MSDADTRTYHSPLRERQARSTREAILKGAAELIVEEGIEGFSMRAVAERASVSERTVYHHFPNRQALLDGFAGWVDEQLRDRRLQADPRDIEDMPERISAIFRAFDEIGAPARAMARLAAVHGIRSTDYRERTRAFRERFADVLEPLPHAEAERCFAIMRHIVSSTTWLTLRDEFDLDPDNAAKAIAWSLGTLLDDLREKSSQPLDRE